MDIRAAYKASAVSCGHFKVRGIQIGDVEPLKQLVQGMTELLAANKAKKRKTSNMLSVWKTGLFRKKCRVALRVGHRTQEI